MLFDSPLHPNMLQPVEARPCCRPAPQLTNHFAGPAPLGGEVDDSRALAGGQVFERLLIRQRRQGCHCKRCTRRAQQRTHPCDLPPSVPSWACAARSRTYLLVLGVRLQLHHLGPACSCLNREMIVRRRRRHARHHSGAGGCKAWRWEAIILLQLVSSLITAAGSNPDQASPPRRSRSKKHR